MKYRTYKTQVGAERYLAKLRERYPEQRSMFFIAAEPQGFRWCVYYQMPDGRAAACM